MDNIIAPVANALSLGWVGSILGIIGIVFGIVTHFLNRQRTKLVYCYSSQRLLGHKDENLPNGITVQHHGTNIPRLSRSILVIWNEGEKTIHRDDLVKTDPLRIDMGEDGKVLTATLIKVSRDVNKLQLLAGIPRPNSVQIDFDFLDKNDGAIIEVLHTSEMTAIAITGTVQGLPRGIKDVGPIILPGQFERKIPFLRVIKPKYFGYFTMALGVGCAIVAYEGMRPTSDPIPIQTLFLFFALIYIPGGAFIAWIMRRKQPKSLSVDESWPSSG